MKLKFFLLLSLFLGVAMASAQQDKPLRVFIRGGVKTHGPGQHDHPRFLAEWKTLLNERGAKADGAMEFPPPNNWRIPTSSLSTRPTA